MTGNSADSPTIGVTDVFSILNGLLGIAANIEATRGADAALAETSDSAGDRVRDRLLRSDEGFVYGTTEDELADAIAELNETEKGHPVIAALLRILRERYWAPDDAASADGII